MFLAEAKKRIDYLLPISHGPVRLIPRERSAEIAYAFDAISWVLKGKTSEADLAMAKTTSRYRAAFVRTGDPNGDGRPKWPRYDPAARSVLDFTNTGVTFGADPRARLDLWELVWERGR